MKTTILTVAVAIGALSEAGYDPLNDFLPISMTGDVPLVLVVNPALPVKNVQELIALAKRRPGEITSGSSGVGSTGHVATEAFSRRAGIRMLNVQYKGAAPAVVDLVGGHLMSRFDQVSTSLVHIRSGKVRALAVTTRKRSPALPDVPTIEEAAGFSGFHDSTFNGLMAPAGTPREIVDRVHAEIVKAVAGPQRAKFLENGVELTASPSPADFGAFLRKEVSEFAVLVKQTKMKPD